METRKGDFINATFAVLGEKGLLLRPRLSRSAFADYYHIVKGGQIKDPI